MPAGATPSPARRPSLPPKGQGAGCGAHVPLLLLSPQPRGEGQLSPVMDGQSQALSCAEACPGHTQPGSSPAEHISNFESVNGHVGPGLPPRELPTPEGKLSVSGELVPSSLPRHLPPATWRVTWPGSEPAGARRPGGRAGSRELHSVGGNRTHVLRCTHVLEHSLSLPLVLSPSSSLVLLFSLLLILFCSP